MKKLILSALMLLSCEVIFAEGTEDMYLYWMIGDNATYDGKSAGAAGLSGYNARVSFDDGATYLYLYEDVGAATLGKSTTFDNVKGLDTIAAFSSSEAVSKSFFVELYNEAAGSTTYRSDAVAYSALSSYISSMEGMAQPADTYVFTTFQSVPEPTSGLLLLLGVAGLALKRKRV